MGMHYCQQGQVRPTHFVVNCKRCRHAVPAGVKAFPADNLVIACPLCGELRRYRPSEVYLGFPHQLIAGQQSTLTSRRRNPR